MKLYKKAMLLGVFFVMSAAAAGAAYIFVITKSLPTIGEISQRQVSQSTKIYDRTEEVLLYEISNGQERTVVPLGEIPEHLKEATIAIEDRRFYESPGFDIRGILRAVWTNVKRGGNPLEGQGASTITQQLAKNAFLTSEQTITRKLKELILATRINEYYTKDEILGFYLNEIPYGPTIYGVEAASRAYFNKPAKDLGLAESAILASIPKAPTYYSPWGSHTNELFSRQKLVLETMLELQMITEEELNGALEEKTIFEPQNDGLLAPHFVLAVRDYLVQKYGERMVGTGGLRVVTTLDWNLQQLAESVVKEGAEENDKLYNGRNAALVAENPKTGEILAVVGSKDYFATSSLPEGCSPGTNCGFEPNFNVATQGLRQPGSALKPFVYLTAFEEGYTPETIVFDTPTEFAANNPKCPPEPDFNNLEKECFHPENFDGVFRGPISLKYALGQSVNVPAVKVLYLAGLENTVKRANAFGLKTLTSPGVYGLSLVLGGGAVRLIDLVGAYSALSQDGTRYDQTMVLEVKDGSGKVLESHKPAANKVADAQPVKMVNSILSDTEIRSGLFQNSLYLTMFPGYDVALKTGTSNDYRDAWAVGYTPSLVVGVWAGNNDNSQMQRRGSSLLAAIPMWSKFLRTALLNFPQETFNKPDPVAPQKPILAGDYSWNNQIHSLLYYVDRKNPQGPPPAEPSKDSQFTNWETSVLLWAANNIENFTEYNQGSDPNTGYNTSSSEPLSVKIIKPEPGQPVGNRIEILAHIGGSSEISKINVYWNGLQIQGLNIGRNAPYDLSWGIDIQNLAPQNLIEIEAIDTKGVSSKTGVIVYR
ncbi:MAG: transglycosylase domain-containing protein [bacterium]|nr:transglycosylase domain-containing protein [bacterium]